MKKTLAILLCISCLIFLNACNQQNQTTLGKAGSSFDASSSSNREVNSFTSSTAGEATPSIETIHEVLSSDVTVDAQVQLSAAVDLTSLSTFRVEEEVQDLDQAKSLFLGDKEIVAEEIHEENPESPTNEPYRLFEAADGCILSGAEELYFGYPWIYDALSTFYDMYDMIEKNDDQFLTGTELSFKSIDGAKTEILDILRELNISVDSDPLVYSFEKEKGAAKDFYLFVFQVTLQDMPVSKYINGSYGDGSMTGGTNVRVAYDENGIQLFENIYKFKLIESIADKQPGKTAKEALSLLDAKYNSIILDGTYTVEKIEFEYVPIPENGGPQLKLVPAWRFFVSREFMERKEDGAPAATSTLKSYVVFDAVTGEELIIDMGNN